MNKRLRLYQRQEIGLGAFGSVYRISPRRIVKVFHEDNGTEEEIAYLLADEIEGSKRKNCLPVLAVIDVIVHRRKTKGLLKRYIPLSLTESECNQFIYNNSDIWDLKYDNLRKDFRGRIYIIDTQTHPYHTDDSQYS